MLQSKVVVVVDVDVDILDTNEVAWALGSRVRPDRDVIIGSNLPGLPIDPSTKADGKVGEFSELQTTTSKIGIDATKPLHELAEFEKIDMPPEVRRKIATLLK